MPNKLQGDEVNYEEAQAIIAELASPDDPIYRPLLRTIRRCSSTVSANGYAKDLRRYFCFLREINVSALGAGRDEIDDYLAGMAHLAAATRARRLAVVRAFYSEALDRDLVAVNPCDRARVKKVKAPRGRAMTLELAGQILRNIEAQFSDPGRELIARRDHLMMEFGFLLGPRSAEMRRISMADVANTSPGSTISFRRKGGKVDEQSLPRRIASDVEAFKEALERHGVAVLPEDPLLLPLTRLQTWTKLGSKRKPLRALDASTIYLRIRMILTDAGLGGAGLGSHRLRRTCATLAYLGGADPIAIQHLLAHSDMETTWKHYIVPEQELLTPAHEAIRL